MGNRVDIILVGAGPANIGAAMELIERNPSLKILMIDKGKPIDKRENKGTGLTEGFAGSSGFSDNKCVYSLSSGQSYGGNLQEYIKDLNYFKHLMDKTDALMMRFCREKNVKTYGGDNNPEIDRLRLNALRKGIFLADQTTIKHYGSDLGREIFTGMYNFLKDKIEIRLETEVLDFNKTKDGFNVVIRNEDDEYEVECKYLVLGVGRSGNKWFGDIAKKKGIETSSAGFDLGCRVEFDAALAKDIDSILYEVKAYIRLKNDVNCRTFCYSPRGSVAMESVINDGIEYVTVNGHSNYEESAKTRNTNFALLVNTKFSKPYSGYPETFAKSIVRAANILGNGKPIMQRYKDIKMGKRSYDNRIAEMNIQPTLKDAVAGDLSLVFPAKIFNAITDSIEILDNLIPGLAGDNTLLTGVEAKWFSISALIKPNMESENIEDLFCIGDGSGCTRSEVQAFMSGFVAAESILNKINKK